MQDLSILRLIARLKINKSYTHARSLIVELKSTRAQHIAQMILRDSNQRIKNNQKEFQVLADGLILSVK